MAVRVLDKYYLGLTAIVTVVYQLLFFAVAFTLKFDKLTDFAGGSNFIVLAIITIVLGSHDPSSSGTLHLPPTRQIVATVLLSVWAFRLAGFLLFRILHTGKDDRFDDKRDRFFPFLGFWVAQMVWVWSVSLPVTVINSPVVQTNSRLLPGFGSARDIAGIVLFGVGFLCEAIADLQRFSFRDQQQRKQQDEDNEEHDEDQEQRHNLAKLAFCQTGLFSWSRHPNYFGEIILQFGIFTIASSDSMYRPHVSNSAPSFAPAVNATIVGPILLTVLLFFVSGMTLSERPAAAKRFQAALDSEAAAPIWDEYCAYLRRTSILIPLPPVLYAPLPVWIKRTLLLEFPIYVFDPAKHGEDQEPAAPQSAPEQTLRNPFDNEPNENDPDSPRKLPSAVSSAPSPSQ